MRSSVRNVDQNYDGKSFLKNSAISFLICVFAIAAILSPVGTGANAAGLSHSGGGVWEYQQEIIVRENSGKTLTDFQVLIELKGNNFPLNTKTNGADIRFMDENGNELDYWIEDWDSISKKATIWVKISKIPSNGEIMLILYSGNPLAANAGSGASTFEFFDHFEGTGIDHSTWHINSGNPSVSDSVLHLKDNCIVSEKIEAFGYNYIFESFSKMSDTGNPPRSFLRTTNNYTILDAGDRFEFGSWETIDEMLLAAVDEEIFIEETNKEKFPTSFEVLGMARSPEGIETFRQYVQKLSLAKNIPDDPLYLQLYSWGGETHSIDWVRVRKYTSFKPTVTIKGAQKLDSVHPEASQVNWMLTGGAILLLLAIIMFLLNVRKPIVQNIQIGDNIVTQKSTIPISIVGTKSNTCPNCGNEIELNEKFCSKCGMRL